MRFKHSWLRLACVGALVLGTVSACDDSNDNEEPSGGAGSTSNGGKGGKGGSGSAGKGGSGGKGGSSATAGTGGKSSGGTGGSAGKGGAGGAKDDDAGTPGDCSGKDECYSCAPTKSEQFLNHCTEAMCSPFDNSKLTKITDGKLPAIP